MKHRHFVEHMSEYRTVEQSQLFPPKNERARVRFRHCFGTDCMRGARCSPPASSGLWLSTEVGSVALLLALVLNHHHERAAVGDRDGDCPVGFGDDLAAGHPSVMQLDSVTLNVEDRATVLRGAVKYCR